MRFAAPCACLLVGAVAGGYAPPALSQDVDSERASSAEELSPYGTVTNIEAKYKPKRKPAAQDASKAATSEAAAQAAELFHNPEALEKAAFDTVTMPGNLDLPAPMLTPERDFDPIAGLRSNSSFPLRIIYGDSDSEDSSWDQIASALQSPPALTRSYAAGKCQFAMIASAYSVRSHERNAKEDYAVEKDGYAAQSILRPLPSKPLALSVTSELQVQILGNSAAACAKTFGQHRIRFAAVAIDSSEIVAVAADDQKTLASRHVKPGESVEVYLGWDERTGSLQLTNRQGLPAGVQTGVHIIEPAPSGVYYLKLTPQWTITRFQRTAKLH